jgi:diguanylate cyclase (GGDEF)-like protein
LNPAFEATATYAPEFPGEPSPSHWPDWLQRAIAPLRPVPPEARDRSTGLYNRAGLFAAANEALRLRAAGAPVSMLVLDFGDLREVYEIYGKAVAQEVLTRIVRGVRAVAGVRGYAGRMGPAQFAVVLPGARPEKTLRIVQRALAMPARVEFDAGDSEIVLVPELLVDMAEPGAESIQPLYREMCHEIARMQKSVQRHEHRLASERERHSRPSLASR